MLKQQPAFVKTFALLFFGLTACFSNTGYSATKMFETSCGKANFFVNVLNKGYAFENIYRLSAETEAGLFELYTGYDEFFAACITSADNKPLLVFQNFCNGSSCVEQNYGVINPESLKLLLQPNPNNDANAQALSTLLGYAAPNLSNYAEIFCCTDQALEKTHKTSKENAPSNSGFTTNRKDYAQPKDIYFIVFGLLFLVGLLIKKNKRS